MNYIKEINSFYDWLELNSVSDSVITLWHALMHINNKAGWNMEFTVAISTLQVKTSLSKSSIIRARNVLKQLGRLDFRERKGNQSCAYKIIAFHSDTQNETQHDTEFVTQADTQTVTQTDTINKLNYTKLNNILLEKEPKEEKLEKENFQELFFDEQVKTKKESSSKKVAQKKVSESELEIPDDFREIWDEWHQYRKAKRMKAYAGVKWEQISLNKLLEMSNREPETARLILKQSYENNYQGFFPLKNDYYGKSNNFNTNNGTGNKTGTNKGTGFKASGKVSARTLLARRISQNSTPDSESGNFTIDVEAVE